MSVGMTLTLHSTIAGCTFLPLTKHITLSAPHGLHSIFKFVFSVTAMLRPSSKDKLGRPALYFKPGRDGFNAEPSGVKYLVYCLERVSLKHCRGSFSEMLWKHSAAKFHSCAGLVTLVTLLLFRAVACSMSHFERSPDRETHCVSVRHMCFHVLQGFSFCRPLRVLIKRPSLVN